jgi:hypothetical protein
MAGFSIFVSLILILSATVMVVFGFVADNWSWQIAAVVVLLYTKGVRSMVIWLRLRPSTRSQKIFIASDFRIMAGAYLLTAVLLFVSWLAGEGMLGVFGAIGFANGAWMFWFVSRRIEDV